MSVATNPLPAIRFLAYGQAARRMYRVMRDQGRTPEQATVIAWGLAASVGRGAISIDGGPKFFIRPDLPGWTRR